MLRIEGLMSTKLCYPGKQAAYLPAFTPKLPDSVHHSGHREGKIESDLELPLLTITQRCPPFFESSWYAICF